MVRERKQLWSGHEAVTAVEVNYLGLGPLELNHRRGPHINGRTTPDGDTEKHKRLRLCSKV